MAAGGRCCRNATAPSPGAVASACAAGGTGWAASRKHRTDVVGGQPLGDLGHAVGRLGVALAGLPGAQLADQVITRQAQQAGQGKLHTREARAVAGAPGGQLACSVALLRQHLPAGQQGRGCGAGCGAAWGRSSAAK